MIVLYNPRSTSGNAPLPMAVLAVGSALEGEFPYELVDGNVEKDPVDRILELGRKHRLTAIGLSVMPGPQLQNAVAHTRKLRRELPDVPIVWGGYFASQHHDTVLKDGDVDYCVRGQGEQTFLELCRLLRDGGDPAAIQGLSYRDGETPKHNANRVLVPLDDLPEWQYEKLPMERYIHDQYLGRRVTDHHSSYGCPFGCNFCAIVSIVNRRWVAQAPERVEAIVRRQHERYGIDALQFHDMDFFIKEDRTAEICDRLTPLGLTWWGLGRVDELMRYSDETWRKMKASGLKMVFCGAEAGSDETLERMNKGGKVSANLTLELAKRMREYGVVPEFSFVLGNPPDPMQDIHNTIGFIRKVKEVNPATELILYMYTPVPKDGLLFDEAQQAGFQFPETLDQWVSDDWSDFSFRRDPQNPWLNPALQREVRNFEWVVNAFYPTVTDLKLKRLKRTILKTLGGWRYKTGFYSYPLELRAFHKLFRYQRPETTGF